MCWPVATTDLYWVGDQSTLTSVVLQTSAHCTHFLAANSFPNCSNFCCGGQKKNTLVLSCRWAPLQQTRLTTKVVPEVEPGTSSSSFLCVQFNTVTTVYVELSIVRTALKELSLRSAHGDHRDWEEPVYGKPNIMGKSEKHCFSSKTLFIAWYQGLGRENSVCRSVIRNYILRMTQLRLNIAHSRKKEIGQTFYKTALVTSQNWYPKFTFSDNRILLPDLCEHRKKFPSVGLFQRSQRATLFYCQNCNVNSRRNKILNDHIAYRQGKDMDKLLSTCLCTQALQ